MPGRVLTATVTAAAALALGLGPVASATAQHRVPPLDQVRAGTTQIAAGLVRPTSITGIGDGRLLITEKPGLVRVYDPRRGVADDPVLDITDRVNESENERGLLGLAPAPNFTRSKVVYAAYTRLPDGAVTLSRFNLATGAEQVLLTQEHAEFANHNGGNVAFGADGYLYLGIGDGGSGGDPFGSGQNLDTLLGKIIRIDVRSACGDLPYCVPGDNPFVGVEGARAEIWSWGLRNPWKFSFDRADGSLWIGDVGQGRAEEIDHIGARQAGVNFGWSCMEGPHVFDETRCEATQDYTEPVFHYRSGVEGCAVIGGHVYRGARYDDLVGGTYIAGDYCSATAWAVRANRDGTYTSAAIGTFPEFLTAIGTDSRGEQYLTDEQGTLHRITFTEVE
ncbi:glucose/sorbosone dehydrogenase-like protein [Actinophytocola xinjiangensis]|uniref:Glucose/sorbosone dehydrogenase-like protein n=1 Tax=Actinophytocola xinjiangensis TaxID=485602 RepID=A0A7Z0WHX0_9PSEU|nr:PQQ-dependent sugar dehydrogenase [Actinophytocola xinjiangensis]OLF05743.1 glucose/sorbosone dehydrogenase-like protein [Actinophytocola xinjiangensis]